MQVIVRGLNIKRAPLGLLEAVSIHHSVLKEQACAIKAKPGMHAAVIVATCNRLEIYATCDDADAGDEVLRAYLHERLERSHTSVLSAEQLDACSYAYSDDAAVEHLFKVVTGLDSLIIGEAEILGQVARAYKSACDAGATDKLMNVWFQRALHLGKRARSDTDLGRHPLSIGHIAVDAARDELGCIDGKRVLIIGAGETCELTMKYLSAYRFPLVMVANRSYERACALADAYGFQASTLDALEEHLVRSDVVFSATSAQHFIIDRSLAKRVMDQRPDRPLLIVDMAVPRDVEPSVAQLDGVSVRNINELRSIADANEARRQAAAEGVQGMIDDEVVQFRRWMQSLELVPHITALRCYADDVKAQYLGEALQKMPGLTASQRHAVDVLATQIVDRFVREPVEWLHDNADSPHALDYASLLGELYGFAPSDTSSCDAQPPSVEQRQAVS